MRRLATIAALLAALAVTAGSCHGNGAPIKSPPPSIIVHKP